MKIAIPSVSGRLCEHFHECGQFAFVDLDETTQTLQGIIVKNAPTDVGGLPQWLQRQGAQVVLSGSIEPQTRQSLCAAGVDVLEGAPGFRVEALVARYLMGPSDLAHHTCGQYPICNDSSSNQKPTGPP